MTEQKNDDYPTLAETVASHFHSYYERLAFQHGYETRPESAVPWNAVPERNRALMVAVVEQLMDDCIIDPGTAAYEALECAAPGEGEG